MLFCSIVREGRKRWEGKEEEGEDREVSVESE